MYTTELWGQKMNELNSILDYDLFYFYYLSA